MRVRCAWTLGLRAAQLGLSVGWLDAINPSTNTTGTWTYSLLLSTSSSYTPFPLCSAHKHPLPPKVLSASCGGDKKGRGLMPTGGNPGSTLLMCVRFVTRERSEQLKKERKKRNFSVIPKGASLWTSASHWLRFGVLLCDATTKGRGCWEEFLLFFCCTHFLLGDENVAKKFPGNFSLT
jgi:hypothetical protein